MALRDPPAPAITRIFRVEAVQVQVVGHARDRACIRPADRRGGTDPIHRPRRPQASRRKPEGRIAAAAPSESSGRLEGARVQGLRHRQVVNRAASR